MKPDMRELDELVEKVLPKTNYNSAIMGFGSIRDSERELCREKLKQALTSGALCEPLEVNQQRHFRIVELEEKLKVAREALGEAIRDSEVFDASGVLEKTFPATVKATRENQKRYKQALQKISEVG